MVVSGRAVFPAIGRIDGARTGLAEGVALPIGTLSELSPRAFANEVLVRFADGVDESAAVADLRSAYESGSAAGITREVLVAQRPAEIGGLRRRGPHAGRARRSPRWRRDRHADPHAADLGAAPPHRPSRSSRPSGSPFERSSSPPSRCRRPRSPAPPSWVAVPLGIIAGRWSWNAFAEQIGALPRPVVPPSLVTGVVLGALVLCNLVALLPGRLAARTEPAAVLRSE